jgi:hypothetical protein
MPTMPWIFLRSWAWKIFVNTPRVPVVTRHMSPPAVLAACGTDWSTDVVS